MNIYYRCLHKDIRAIQDSSSGAAFTALSDYILMHMGGVVYGCILNENFDAEHIRADNIQMRNRMRGSKYIASKIGKKIYESVYADLKNRRIVLFTGTPCQIAALKKYLSARQVSEEFLYTAEVVCHGVGSELFFKDYISHLESKYRGKAVNCKFRAKYHAGQKQDMEVKFDNEKIYHASSTRYDWFYSVYLKNLILRPSCYVCKFASVDRKADLSLADLWAEAYQQKPYSLIIVNSDKGNKLFEKASIAMECSEMNEQEIHIPYMHAPARKPYQRDAFWTIYQRDGYMEAQKWIGNNTFPGKCKALIVFLAQQFHIAQQLKKIWRKFHGF